MFEAYTDGDTLGFDLNVTGNEEAIDVAGGVTGGENDGTAQLEVVVRDKIAAYTTDYAVVLNEEVGHASLKMDFAATAEDGSANVLDDAREAVGADVRMRIGKDSGGCAVLAEDVKDLLHGAAFLGACVELAVGISPCPTLAKRVVAFGVNNMLARNTGEITFALMNILATLDDDRPQPQLDETQSSEESAWACTHDDDLRTPFHIWIFYALEGFFGHRFINPHASRDVDHDLPLAGIDATLDDTQPLNTMRFERSLAGHARTYILLCSSLLGQQAELNVADHPSSAGAWSMSSRNSSSFGVMMI